MKLSYDYAMGWLDKLNKYWKDNDIDSATTLFKR